MKAEPLVAIQYQQAAAAAQQTGLYETEINKYNMLSTHIYQSLPWSTSTAANCNHSVAR